MIPAIALPRTRISLSALCLGNAAFGTGMPQQLQDRHYSTFRAAGGSCFDTAHCYCFWLPGGAGSSERDLGDCIRRHGDVGKVQILTKGGHPDAGAAYPRPDQYLSPEIISRDLSDSLNRLRMDAIDVFFLHRDDRRVPVGEIMDCLNRHLDADWVRAIGASNWSTSRIEEANQYAGKHGLIGFTVSQPQFNLGQPNAPVPTIDPVMRYLTDEDIAWHTAQQLPVVCYAPTAGGYFASSGQRSRAAYENPTSLSRLQRAGQLADQLRVTTNQIALAYLIHQPFPVIPVLGTANLQHLIEAIGSIDIELTESQLAWLRDGITRPPVPSPGTPKEETGS